MVRRLRHARDDAGCRLTLQEDASGVCDLLIERRLNGLRLGLVGHEDVHVERARRGGADDDLVGPLPEG